jgi:hypothetical protein
MKETSLLYLQHVPFGCHAAHREERRSLAPQGRPVKTIGSTASTTVAMGLLHMQLSDFIAFITLYIPSRLRRAA